MTAIELITLLLVVFMVVPDLTARARRPALAYAVFVLVGILLGELVTLPVRAMMLQVGSVGFLLLLFEVGLDIELPSMPELRLALRTAGPWLGINAALAALVAMAIGFSPVEAVIGAVALSACSVGMAYVAWRSFPGLDDDARRRLLHVMVLVEMLAMAALAIGASFESHGASWLVLVNLGAIVALVVALSRFGSQLTRLFEHLLGSTTKWRMHVIVLLILLIAALGERLGLSGAKTTFFLGLFMAHVHHDGRTLEEYLAPVSRGLLIPACFVSLGMHIEWTLLGSPLALWAALCGGGLLACRWLLARRVVRVGEGGRAFLLLSPNLTVVALAAATLFQMSPESAAARWLLLTGVVMTVLTLVLLPAAPAPASAIAPQSEAA